VDSLEARSPALLTEGEAVSHNLSVEAASAKTSSDEAASQDREAGVRKVLAYP